MSCNAKKDPNGTWRIQYRWTDWTGTKKKSQKRGFKTMKERLVEKQKVVKEQTQQKSMHTQEHGTSRKHNISTEL